METIKQPTTTTTEMQTILTGAMQISQQYGLKEICTEAVLYAMLENETLPANGRLLSTGINIYMLKRLLGDKLAIKRIDGAPAAPPYSVALEGLLALSLFERNNTSLTLLTLIIKNNNTAAARWLRRHSVSLTPKNELIYKPIIN